MTRSMLKEVSRTTQYPVMSQSSALVPVRHAESHVTPSGGSHCSSPTTTPSPHTLLQLVSLHCHPGITRHSTQPPVSARSHSSAPSFVRLPQSEPTGSTR